MVLEPAIRPQARSTGSLERPVADAQVRRRELSPHSLRCSATCNNRFRRAQRRVRVAQLDPIWIGDAPPERAIGIAPDDSLAICHDHGCERFLERGDVGPMLAPRRPPLITLNVERKHRVTNAWRIREGLAPRMVSEIAIDHALPRTGPGSLAVWHGLRNRGMTVVNGG
jgi:hypothetical protein